MTDLSNVDLKLQFYTYNNKTRDNVLKPVPEPPAGNFSPTSFERIVPLPSILKKARQAKQ